MFEDDPNDSRYTTNDGTHLKRLTKDLPLLKEMGITAMWLPPLCKGLLSSCLSQAMELTISR